MITSRIAYAEDRSVNRLSCLLEALINPLRGAVGCDDQ